MWLGERATERNLKALSRQGELRALQGAALCHPRRTRWRELLKAKAEPALILTPPKEGARIAELEEDDGRLAPPRSCGSSLTPIGSCYRPATPPRAMWAMPRPSQLSERSANVREDHMCTARSWH